MNTFLSVIIPTCNRNDLLEKCLSLLSPDKQLLDGTLYEIIVTDDSKTSIAKQLIQNQFPWVTWTKGPQKGPAANRNNGVKLAKGTWLVFIDDDCMPNTDLLFGYYNAISQPENINIKAYEGAILPEFEFNPNTEECPTNTSGGLFWSANICIGKELFDNIDGFDENYKIAAQEDQDIYIRLKKHTEVVFLPNNVVVHPIRKYSLTRFIQRINISMINWFYFAQKNKIELGYKNNTGIILYAYKFHILSLIKAIKNLYWKKIAGGIITMLYGIPMLVLYIGKQLLRGHQTKVLY